jgi:hypothetical protein
LPALKLTLRNLCESLFSGNLNADYLKFTDTSAKRKAELADTIFKAANGFKSENSVTIGESVTSVFSLAYTVRDNEGMLEKFIIGILESLQLADKGDFTKARVMLASQFDWLGLDDTQAQKFVDLCEQGYAISNAKAQLRSYETSIKQAYSKGTFDALLPLYASESEAKDINEAIARCAAFSNAGNEADADEEKHFVFTELSRLSKGKLTYDFKIADAFLSAAKAKAASNGN